MGQGRLVWVMLNPSTATDTANDPTVRRCIGFAIRWGYRVMDVTNLSPVRATDPSELLIGPPESADVWDRNIRAIRETVEALTWWSRLGETTASPATGPPA